MNGWMDIAEVFEMAEQIERDGAAFYREAAATSPFSAASQILLELASMEDEHQQVFSVIKERGYSGRSEATEGLDMALLGDKVSVARFLASGLKEDLASRFTGWNSGEQILNIAIGFEKDTIVFFAHLKGMLSVDADRKQVDQLILEEMGHVIKLTGQFTAAILPPDRRGRTGRAAPAAGEAGSSNQADHDKNPGQMQ